MKSIFFTFETPVTAALIDYSAPLLHTYEFLIITQVHVSVFPLSLHGGRPKLNNVNLAFANLLNREPFFFFFTLERSFSPCSVDAWCCSALTGIVPDSVLLTSGADLTECCLCWALMGYVQPCWEVWGPTCVELCGLASFLLFFFLRFYAKPFHFFMLSCPKRTHSKIVLFFEAHRFISIGQH